MGYIMRIDHFAVDALKLTETVDWYVQRFGADVLYQDATWAFLKVGGSKIALLAPGQHPPHLAFSLTPDELSHEAQRWGKAIKAHRDGTQSIYVEDPSGNAVELIAYPPGHAYGSHVK